jgi:hypothetical protein
MLADDMPEPHQLLYPTLDRVQWRSELGDDQKKQIDEHRASRLKKNPAWIRNTMVKDTYLQIDTPPTVPNNRQSKQLAKFAKEHGLWERLDGICQTQATQGSCRHWNKKCQAWH